MSLHTVALTHPRHVSRCHSARCWGSLALAGVALASLGGCGEGASGNDVTPSTAKAQTTAVPPPPLPITIESPDDGTTIRGRRRGQSRATLRVQIAGGAEPGSALRVDGGCAARSCRQTLSADEVGAWTAELELSLPATTRRQSVKVSYIGLDFPREGTRVSLRVRVPRAPRPVRVARERPRPGNRQPEAVPTTSVPFTTPAPVQGGGAGSGRMVMIGDSLAEGLAGLLPGSLKGWQVSVNAAIGRHLAEGVQILRQTTLPSGSVLGISLYTNDDPWRTGELEAAVRESVSRVGTSGCAVWATIAAPPVDGLSYRKANDLLNSLAARIDRLKVVPWAEAMAANPSMLGRDGVHPTPEGYRLRAQMYAQAARACAAS